MRNLNKWLRMLYMVVGGLLLAYAGQMRRVQSPWLGAAVGGVLFILAGGAGT